MDGGGAERFQPCGTVSTWWLLGWKESLFFWEVAPASRGYFTSTLRSAALQKKEEEEEEAVVRWQGSIKGLQGVRQGVRVGYDQDTVSKNKNYN